MRKINYKAVMAILTIGRRSKKNVDWTLAIAIFSTMVTVGLILLYVWQGQPDPQWTTRLRSIFVINKEQVARP
jgi:hypothetical protein